MESNITEHTHNGVDSKKIKLEDLDKKTGVLAIPDMATISQGGSEFLRNEDSFVIQNLRQRLNELEVILKANGILK